MRLIDADALLDLMIETLEKIKANPKMDNQEVHIISAFHTVGLMVEDAPTIYAIPVVRCKECKYMEYMSTCTKNGIRISRVPNDYCSRGVRKDE